MKKRGNSLSDVIPKTGWSVLAGFCVSFFTATSLLAQSAEPYQQRCGSAEYERLVLQLRDPNRQRNIQQLNQQLNQVQTQQKFLRQSANQTIYRIPVVVHVIHSNASGTVGGTNNGNISDEQVASQIQVLNEDYRRQVGTPGENTTALSADAGIEFSLATRDPNGNATSGITRHYYDQKSSFDVYTDDLTLSNIAYWPSNRYLNIWVTTLDNNFLGFGQFPTAADTIQGLPTSQNERIDGLMVDHKFFGRQTGTATSSLYGYGRTVTHEIGHWLGLIHTWGDGDGCAEDYVYDTPPTKGSNQTTQCRTTYSTCVNNVRTRDLTEDYMDYSPDRCMNLFTVGQVARMRAVLQLSPRRVQLINSVVALPEAERLTINVYPNPAASDPTVDVQLKGSQSFTVVLYDMAGRVVRQYAYANSPSTRVTLTTTGLSTGMYIVRVKTDNETVSSRLVVN